MQDRTIRLTQYTECGGCAAKIGAEALSAVLANAGLPPPPEALIAGLVPPDDAAAFALSAEMTILGTVDFFPPIVDDPVVFGEIAAANALSDVFAMGGRPIFALAIAAWPEGAIARALAGVLHGAASKLAEAGAPLAGGHTIRDREPKFGLAVVGTAAPGRLLRKSGANPGDALVLTKPLGTGLIVSGHRRELIGDRELDAAIGEMTRLNDAASDACVQTGIASATDITGFGLLGHALEIAQASRVELEFEAAALPALPGALEIARAGVETDGAKATRRLVRKFSRIHAGVDRGIVALAHDPQTSGGLLAAVPRRALASILDRLDGTGTSHWIVGRVLPGPARISLV